MKRFLTVAIMIALVAACAVCAFAADVANPYDEAAFVATYDGQGRMLSFEKVTARTALPEGAAKVTVFKTTDGKIASSTKTSVSTALTGEGYALSGTTLTLNGENIIKDGAGDALVEANPWLVLAGTAAEVRIEASVGKISAAALSKISAPITFDGKPSEFEALLEGETAKIISYTKEDTYYTVTFSVGANGSSTSLLAGTVPTYTGSTEKAGYTFDGWLSSLDGRVHKTLPAVTGNVTYTALYTQIMPDAPTVNTYTVTFAVDLGNYSYTYEEGAIPTFNGNKDKSGYVFAGWLSSLDGRVYTTLPAVTGNVTYTAQYTQIAPQPTYYTVTFSVNGTTTNVTVQEGGFPAFTGSTTKENYVFTGWLSSADGQTYTTLPAVTGNVTYTAQYTQIAPQPTYYTVTFSVNGTTTNVTVQEGGFPAFTGSTAKENYVFTGWLSSADGQTYTTLPAVTGNVTYTAQYTPVIVKYTVTFDVDGTFSYQEYEAGQTPAFAGAVDKQNYVFTGWLSSADGQTYTTLPAVTGNVTYTAQYTPVIVKYTITFVVNGGSVTYEVEAGTSPTYTGEKPTKATDDTYSYNFYGWIDSSGNVYEGNMGEITLPAATKDETYTPNFKTGPKDDGGFGGLW